MSSLLIGLLGAAMATNQPAALSNLVSTTTGISISVPAGTNDAVELELQKIMDDDDAAAAEVDKWIQENEEFRAKGAGVSDASLNTRIRKRLGDVRQAYEDFIKRHPENPRVRIAFASYLNSVGDEDEELVQLEKARELDPRNPAAWNQLANYHGHRGPTEDAFICYEKAIELDPTEPVYYWNFATTVYLFRPVAMERYHITEPEVFNKALALYDKALKLDPKNFTLATDLAMSYYGIKPMRTADALNAWTNALNLAGSELDRERVFVHLARFNSNSGRFGEARVLLNSVTNSELGEIKERLMRNLNEKEKEAAQTNSPAAGSTNALSADAAHSTESATNLQALAGKESAKPGVSPGK